MVIGPEYTVGVMSKDNTPAAYCEDGDTVTFITKDCYDGSVTSVLRPDGDRKVTKPNPATGPLFVKGAQKGDILQVCIDKIKVNDSGIMRSSPTGGVFHKLYDRRTARFFDLRDDIVFDEHLTLQQKPMIGVIGTACEGEGIDTVTPYDHGGNMDVRTINEGSVLYLPVNTEGALLAMGDVHALMGDGETFICGIETGAEITVTVHVVRDIKLPLPLLVNEDTCAVIASAETLDEAADKASWMMMDLVRGQCGLDDLDAGMLLSLKGNLVICQVVNPLKTVRMEMDTAVFRAYNAPFMGLREKQ